MLPVRIIARLDIKGNRLIKGIHLEGWRFVGDPNEYSRKYYESGIDEIIYLDAVASLYSRDMLKEVLVRSTKDIFIPLTAGGGVRSVDDAYQLLRSGADKVVVNTGAVKNPNLISEIANKFGKQCMVLSIEAKRVQSGKWEVYVDCGREPTGLDVVEWVKEAVERGAGEILLTSIDQEGTGNGFDIELIKKVSSNISVPVIASGGFGKCNDFVEAVRLGSANAVAIADAFHYNKVLVKDLRSYVSKEDILVRQV